MTSTVKGPSFFKKIATVLLLAVGYWFIAFSILFLIYIVYSIANAIPLLTGDAIRVIVISLLLGTGIIWASKGLWQRWQKILGVIALIFAGSALISGLLIETLLKSYLVKLPVLGKAFIVAGVVHLAVGILLIVFAKQKNRTDEFDLPPKN